MSEHQSSRLWIAGLITVIALAAATYLFLNWSGGKHPEPEVVPQPQPEVVPEAEPEPQKEAPAPEPTPQAKPQRQPAPLNASDKDAYSDLLSLAPDGALAKWLVPDEVIRKWVAAANAAASGDLVTKHRPFIQIKEPFVVDKAGATGMVLSEDNYWRYDQPVRLFVNMDTDKAIAIYKFWYPRLAQAYSELGMKEKSFHRVVLKAIDQALAAPQAEQPIQLVRPSVYYKFADPKLEKLPGIHKLMIRMGPNNAQRVKEKLREIKAALQQLQL